MSDDIKNETMFRIYADGEVIHEDDFKDKDNSSPYQDDFELVVVPDLVLDYIQPNNGSLA